MPFILLSAVSTLSLTERLSIGTEVMLVGLSVVFVVLILLWGILELFRVLFYDLPNKNKKSEPDAAAEKDSADTDDEADNGSDAGVSDDTDPNDGELIAAITAAVTAYMSDENKPALGDASPKFRVVSFRRVGK